MKTDFSTFAITEVSFWLNEQSYVQLPVIQRGFVWKTSQIERLWDSIFRGYPIGSLMMSSSGDKYMLLDGQQRATSIALGYYNPWKEESRKIGNVTNLPVVWIDIASGGNKTDTQEYVFRVVTHSHPWGYQLKNNREILSVPQRRAASEMYEKLFMQPVYTKLLPTQRLPYDAACPIPLCFLLDAVRWQKNARWLIDICKESIPAGYRPSRLPQEETYFSMLEKIDFTGWFSLVCNVLKTNVPAIIIPSELLVDRKDSSSDESTLFLRLNSQGTRIEGEELMYSMFKAACPETKDLVESIGMNIVPPSRVITHISRLILSETAYVPKLNLAQFRKHVLNDSFVEKMKMMIGIDGDSTLKKIMRNAVDILRYGNTPDVVVKKFIREASDGFMLLLHWLIENKDVHIDEGKKREISSRLYRNYWFGDDFQYYVSKNWTKVTEPNFWSDPYFLNEGCLRQYPLIRPSLLLSFFMNRLEHKTENLTITPDDGEIWSLLENDLPKPDNITDDDYEGRIKGAWQNYIGKLSYNKSLILLAQRDYINRSFSDFNQIEDLEDTNTPWDWDHIYPKSWVQGRWYVDERTKRWEERIGNYRAMSLTDNRSENNNWSPAERFDTINDDYFIKENDLEYWKKLDAFHKNIREGDEEYIQNHAKAIITRSVNIYENFLKMFGL